MFKQLRAQWNDFCTVGVCALVGLMLAACAMVWFFALRQIETDRHAALQAEIHKNANLALSHAERATRAFNLLDQLLLAIRNDYLKHGGATDLGGMLNALQVGRSRVVAAVIVNANGRVEASTLDSQVNYSDREYFSYHRDHAADELLIGQPILGRVSQQWIVTLTRRINRPDGTFAGVVVVSISPLFLATEYEQTVQGPHASLALIGLDGFTRVRRNAGKVSFGDDARASRLFRELPQRPVGHYIGVAASDGVRRLAAYHRLNDYPMVSVVASSYEEVLAATLPRERLYLGGATGVSILVLAVGITGVSYNLRRRRFQSAVEDSERRYRLLFENSLDAVVSIAPEGHLVAANPAALLMFRLEDAPLSQITRDEMWDVNDVRLTRLLASEAESGRMQGAVRMFRHDGEAFEAEISAQRYPDGSQLSSMVVRDISDRKHADDQIRHLAFFDALTGLPNRRLLMDRLGHALTSSQRHQHFGALFFVDLDNFKVLNDTLGHFKGDMLLQLVAQRLVASVRECDTCARLGGDEFVVMVDDLSKDETEASKQAETVGWKILQALSEPYVLSGASFHSTPSIGLTLFGSRETSIDEPLKRADLAMYQAKAAGRNTLRIYDPLIKAAMVERASLENALRVALQGGQFVLHYQPQVHQNARVEGAEALLRWAHPARGLVPPNDFIPLAEETGLIVPIGLWVLDTACAQLARWAEDPTLSSLTLSVNVSERQFNQSDFVPKVLETIQRTGARPDRLRLEITEGLLITQMSDVVAKMHQIKTSGVGFELDDFGTGYSSLVYLKQLPIDRLKIDRGFVRDVLSDPNDTAITRAIILLAQSLGLAVIAEGVETPEQQAFLHNHGCLDQQGFLFSRPLPVDAFEEWVRDFHVAESLAS